MKTPTLIIKRLILIRFADDDSETFFIILNDEEVNKFSFWYSMKIQKKQKSLIQSMRSLLFKKDNMPIDYVNIDMIDIHNLNYGLCTEYRHKGIVTEAAKAVIEQVKNDGISYITSMHDRNNPRSGIVMQACGMKYCYTYEEQWQPKNITVYFRMYQLNLNCNKDFVYKKILEYV